MKNNFSIIGAGSWGTAIANLLGDKGLNVTLWTFEKELAEEIELERSNTTYLKGYRVSVNITATNDLPSSVKGAKHILLVAPSKFIRTIIEEMEPHVASDAIIITAVKGIEKGSLKTTSAIIKEYLGNRLAVLSGPSFAKEVSDKKPTAVTLAVEDAGSGAVLQEIFNTEYFRVYTNDDLIGVEIGGALKNVISIASGICDGLKLGLNSRAALITRGLAEIIRLGVVMGAKEKTFAGLSGLGDLVLTGTGTLSRNYTVGCKLGEGLKLEEILSETQSVAEGVETSASAYALSKQYGVEMPIVEQVYRVIHESKDPRTAVVELMTRGLKNEF